jgi:hypothetical protein
LLLPERIAARIEFPRVSAVIVVLVDDLTTGFCLRNRINDVSALVNFMTMLPFVFWVNVSGHVASTTNQHSLQRTNPKIIQAPRHHVNN